jgi:hypothetical protein
VIHPVLLRKLASQEVIPLWPFWAPPDLTGTGGYAYKTLLKAAALRLRCRAPAQARRRPCHLPGRSSLLVIGYVRDVVGVVLATRRDPVGPVE